MSSVNPVSGDLNQVVVSGSHYPVGLKLCTQYPVYGREESASVLVEVIATPDAPQRGPQLPMEVVYVIDISGSMSNNMPVLNAALQFLCQSTPEHHSVSIVVFNSEASVYWPMTKMTSSAKQQLRNKQPLKADGYTNIAVGVYQGLNQFSTPSERKESESEVKNRDADVTQRFVVLLSDGVPTHGPKTSDDILTVLQRHAQFSAVQIIAMAIGAETDRELLSKLALKSQGKMYFVQNLDQLPCALGDCLGSFLSVVASRLSVEIEAEQVQDRNAPVAREDSTSCMRSRSTLAAQQIDAHRLAFQLGTLYFGEQRSILVDIPAPFAGFVARIRYLDASTGNPVTLERRLNIPRSNLSPSEPRVESVDVAVQLLRTEGQQIITRAAETQDTVELEALQKRIVEGPYADHPVAKCLLVDICRLLQLAVQALREQALNSARRQVTGNAYSMACASAGVTMATQQSVGYGDPMDTTADGKEEEDDDEDSNELGLASLRRAMSAKCSQHTKSVTKKK